jgi:hypothetical protein
MAVEMGPTQYSVNFADSALSISSLVLPLNSVSSLLLGELYLK